MVKLVTGAAALFVVFVVVPAILIANADGANVDPAYFQIIAAVIPIILLTNVTAAFLPDAGRVRVAGYLYAGLVLLAAGLAVGGEMAALKALGFAHGTDPNEAFRASAMAAVGQVYILVFGVGLRFLRD